MKRNLVPLLGIALVVAIISTGVFYGLFVGRLTGAIHATDSSGIVSILRPGHRVDVQLVAGVGALPELRTILQNIEVLSVIPPPDNRTNPVITLLVDPEGADMAGLGDSTAR